MKIFEQLFKKYLELITTIFLVCSFSIAFSQTSDSNILFIDSEKIIFEHPLSRLGQNAYYGEMMYNFKDDEPYFKGYFGFRTVKNRMRIDELKIIKK